MDKMKNFKEWEKMASVIKKLKKAYTLWKEMEQNDLMEIPANMEQIKDTEGEW
jgi:hypothetical protein